MCLSVLLCVYNGPSQTTILKTQATKSLTFSLINIKASGYFPNVWHLGRGRTGTCMCYDILSLQVFISQFSLWVPCSALVFCKQTHCNNGIACLKFACTSNRSSTIQLLFYLHFTNHSAEWDLEHWTLPLSFTKHRCVTHRSPLKGFIIIHNSYKKGWG